MRIFLLSISSTFLLQLSAQTEEMPAIEDALTKFDFIQEQIFQNNDTITYYLRNYQVKPTKLVVFIQGTDANPLFSYSLSKGQTKFYRWFGDDYKNLDSSYTYAIIPKPGMEGLFKDGEVMIPTKYYEKNYLDYRVQQIDLSINHIVKTHLSRSDKVIVYGHSEGAAIGAALATLNTKITHLGFWSGNVLNNFYEFSLFNRIESLQSEMSDEAAHQNILGILQWYQSVIENPNSIEIDHYGFTNKRWSSYEKAAIDYLVQLTIPIYALFATEDQSTPIETAYLLPIKFIENRKKNLTFEVCMNCDHSYRVIKESAEKSHWNREFMKFMQWANH